MKNDKELKHILKNLETLSDHYTRETKDLISIIIVLEQNLIRLNHLLTNIRNMMADEKTNKVCGNCSNSSKS